MPGLVLHSSAKVSCFHSATATVVPAGPSVQVSGSPVTTTSTLQVAGCPFQVPIGTGTKPQPCITVSWSSVSTKVRVNGQALLLQTPPGSGPGAGICKTGEQIPQGAPQVQQMQTRVTAT
jgi:hypothetical protein